MEFLKLVIQMTVKFIKKLSTDFKDLTAEKDKRLWRVCPVHALLNCFPEINQILVKLFGGDERCKYGKIFEFAYHFRELGGF
jgi:hypothetical protein